MAADDVFGSELTAFDLSYRVPPDDELKGFIWEALSQGRVLTVAKDRPAADVATQVDRTGSDIVVVVDEQAMRGFIFPNWITTQVEEYRGRRPRSLARAVEVLSEAPMVRTRADIHQWLYVWRSLAAYSSPRAR